jgi:S-adenosylmethionine:tRNA ribosyltransferase-isomerase
MQLLDEKGLTRQEITLHVGAGTFMPVKVENATEHPMHSEQISVPVSVIESLAKTQGRIIPIGTTAMRTLETLYWLGVKLHQNPEADFNLSQTYAWEHGLETLPTFQVAYTWLADALKAKGIAILQGNTSIYIYPGYRMRVCKALVTNFHQPGSTLMLLIAALIGNRWKEVYKQALEQNYRFLSYGDSSLLIAEE